jgi:hypothetical protein
VVGAVAGVQIGRGCGGVSGSGWLDKTLPQTKLS